MELSRPSVAIAIGVTMLLGLGACGDDSPEAMQTAPTAPTRAPQTVEPATTEIVTPATTDPPPTSTQPATLGSDPANAYLGRTTEIYRRTLPDGDEFVVRLSTESYATVFGFNWLAPTGSAELCLGDHAVFLGVPDRFGGWGSAWVAAPWYDRTDPSLPVALQSTMQAAGDPTVAPQYLLVRADTASDGATEVVLSETDGTELDRSTVSNGVAVLVLETEGFRSIDDVRVSLVTPDGTKSQREPIASGEQVVSAECGPGEAPPRPLPEPGRQPTNPTAAEAQIRQRHALLVDQSIPFDEKPAGLLDDATGVQDAIARMDAGPCRDVAASAKYDIDQLVFTRPEEAWFRYTIATSTQTYVGQFGMAVLGDAGWQITRDTICQDLAAAAASCQPEPTPIDPPLTAEWEAAWQEWTTRAGRYSVGDGCAPLSQC